LAYFCPNLVAMATPFAPLKIQIAYLNNMFEFADPENYTLHAKSVSISCTELRAVLLWLIFAHIWLPWQRPLLP